MEQSYMLLGYMLMLVTPKIKYTYFVVKFLKLEKNFFLFTQNWQC